TGGVLGFFGQRQQQNLSARHVGCVLFQAASGLFERKPSLNLGLQITGKQSLDLPCNPELAQQVSLAQPCGEPEAFHTFSLEDQRCRVDLARLKRQCAIYEQTTPAWLRA